MLQLAVLKGLAQGCIVTVPAMLMIKFFHSEGALGPAISIGTIIAASCSFWGTTQNPNTDCFFSIGLISFFSLRGWTQTRLGEGKGTYGKPGLGRNQSQSEMAL